MNRSEPAPGLARAVRVEPARLSLRRRVNSAIDSHLWGLIRTLATGFPWLHAVGWALIVYLVLSTGSLDRLPASVNVYLGRPLLWLTLALVGAIGWLAGLPTRPRPNRVLIAMALLAGAFYLSIWLLAGLLFGFGHSPYGHRPLILLGNLFYAGSILAGVEISRACIVVGLARRRPLVAIVVPSLLFTILGVPPARWTSLDSIQGIFPLVGETLLPGFAENLLASYLALLGGPLAAIAYRGLPQAFEWLSPILPNLDWMVTAFIGTMAPALGMIFIRDLTHSRSVSVKEPGSSQARTSTGWVLVAAVTVALLWFNIGLFGVRPTLVSGVSMEPALQAGDVVITRPVNASEIQLGDIVRFQRGGVFVLHRVVEVLDEQGDVGFVTKGDANNVIDEPVLASQVEGKVIAVVPGIGWIAIAARALLDWVL